MSDTEQKDSKVKVLENGDIEITVSPEPRASGTLTFSNGGGGVVNLAVRWSSVGNVSNKTSTVSATMTLYAAAEGYCREGSYLSINGNSKSYGQYLSSPDSPTTFTLVSHSVSVPHNSDGTKTITIAGALAWHGYMWNGKGVTVNTLSGSSNVTLDKLLSPPSAPTWCKASGRYEAGEKVSVSWGGASGTISSYNVQYRQWDLVTGWTSWSNAGTGITGTSMQHQIVSVGNNRKYLQYRAQAVNSAGGSGWSSESENVPHYGVKVNASGFRWATVKVWNGSSWVDGIVKIWNGSSWVAAK